MSKEEEAGHAAVPEAESGTRFFAEVKGKRLKESCQYIGVVLEGSPIACMGRGGAALAEVALVPVCLSKHYSRKER